MFRGESRGFGFVRYKSVADVEHLLKVNPRISVCGRKVFYARALKRSRSDVNRKLWMISKRRQESVKKLHKGVEYAELKVGADIVRAKSFKEALVGEDLGNHQKDPNYRSKRFSYVESSTKEWLSRSVVGRCRSRVDFHKIQEETRVSGLPLTVTLAGAIYCLISFQDVVSMSRVLNIGASWFDDRALDISPWASSDLANSSTIWVRLGGVPIPLWGNQLFAFVGNELGRLLEISPATIDKVNLSEAWIKIAALDVTILPRQNGDRISAGSGCHLRQGILVRGC